MSHSPLSASLDPDLSGSDALPIPLQIAQPGPAPDSNSVALLELLRRSLETEGQPADSVLRAATEAARVLSGADGTALALRTKGVIVCRARSGDIAPELGATLNSDSGISGECLRTATILLCNDAATDHRVDPAVCRMLGVRSIVAVPLRGPMGVAGILEAFSTRVSAFDSEHINSLRALAEIAETAYERERAPSPPPASPVRSARFVPRAFTDENVAREFSMDLAPKRRYWLYGVVATALLSASLVAWWSWREPAAEIAASETPARTTAEPTTAPSSTPSTAALKPTPGISVRPAEHVRPKDVLRNAAEIEPAREEPVSEVTANISPAERPSLPAAHADPTTEVVEPPVPTAGTATIPDAVAKLAAAPAPLPAFGARVSEGVVNSNLIRKVTPTYPAQARIQGLTGTVDLDATIATDGTVREINAVSGNPLLVAAAKAAVKQWRYSPPLLNGKPIELQKRITLIFKLP